MLNLILVEQRIALVSGYLSELEKLAATPRQDFLADKVKTAAAESYLRRSLEAIFDAGRHILAKSGHADMAGEYKAIALGLVQQAVVDASLGPALLQMAGYRNRLVHLYNEISDDELYGILGSDLGDIRSFVRQIREFLVKARNQGLGQR
jgi:uncharacterized protein YutE (UPF0331/DUF86 family)